MEASTAGAIEALMRDYDDMTIGEAIAADLDNRAAEAALAVIREYRALNPALVEHLVANVAAQADFITTISNGDALGNGEWAITELLGDRFDRRAYLEYELAREDEDEEDVAD